MAVECTSRRVAVVECARWRRVVAYTRWHKVASVGDGGGAADGDVADTWGVSAGVEFGGRRLDIMGGDSRAVVARAGGVTWCTERVFACGVCVPCGGGARMVVWVEWGGLGCASTAGDYVVGAGRPASAATADDASGSCGVQCSGVGSDVPRARCGGVARRAR